MEFDTLVGVLDTNSITGYSSSRQVKEGEGDGNATSQTFQQSPATNT